MRLSPALLASVLGLGLLGCGGPAAPSAAVAPSPTSASSTASAAAPPAAAPSDGPAEAPGPALPTLFDAAAIDAYVADQVKRRELVGASLVIVREGAVVLARGYGVTSLATPEPVTPDTAFGIGSITKQFVCAGALLLADDRKLSLDDKVARWYPELTRARDITLDDLGAHLSGYPDYYPLDYVDRRMRQPIETDEILRRYATTPLEYEPRTRFSYSNTGFILLARVIEKVSKRPLAELLRERVFAPLGMTHASFEPALARPGVAAGHSVFALGPPRPIRPEAADWLHGAAGMVASANDLARWDLGLIDGKVLSRRSLRRMTTAHTRTDGRSTDYGCGIGVRRVAGETVLSHSGAVAGFLAYNTIVPRTRSAVILLVNSENGSPGELHQQVLSLVVGPSTFVPAVKGPPAAEVALDLLHQLQRGALDRATMAPALVDYFEDGGLAAASARLGALGEPTEVETVETRARGGMEVTTIRFKFATGSVEALVFRSPDGVVHQLLLSKD